MFDRVAGWLVAEPRIDLDNGELLVWKRGYYIHYAVNGQLKDVLTLREGWRLAEEIGEAR